MRKLLILFVSALLPWLSVRSQKPVYKDAGQPVEARVKDLLNRMTLHEKVLQLNQYTFGENDNPNNNRYGGEKSSGGDWFADLSPYRSEVT